MGVVWGSDFCPWLARLCAYSALRRINTLFLVFALSQIECGLKWVNLKYKKKIFIEY